MKYKREFPFYIDSNIFQFLGITTRLSYDFIPFLYGITITCYLILSMLYHQTSYLKKTKHCKNKQIKQDL